MSTSWFFYCDSNLPPDLIQMELFHNEIDTTGIKIFEQEGKYSRNTIYTNVKEA